MSTLDNNILCGNSLIEDPKIASKKAFDWHKHFPAIMQHGGFDIVVGNPPYVVVKGGRFLDGYEFSKEEIKFIKKHFQTAQQQINTYILFVERFVKLLKNTGFLSFIIPNTFLSNEYSQKFREFLLDETKILGIYNVGLAFEQANVEALVLTLNHRKRIKTTKIKIEEEKRFIDLAELSQLTEDKKFLLHINQENLSIIQKLGVLPKLKEFAKVWRGLTTGNDKKYIVTEATKAKHKKLITGTDVQKYLLNEVKKYVYYDSKLLDRARDERIFLLKEKLLSKFVGSNLTFCYDDKQHYVVNTACITEVLDKDINIKYLLTLLNSKLLNFYFSLIFTDNRSVFPIMKSGNIEQLPIIKIPPNQQKPFIEKAEITLSENKNLEEIRRDFLDLLVMKYKPQKISQKLEKWYLLNFEGFVQEIDKGKPNKKLSKLNLSNLRKIKKDFETFQKEALGILEKIEETNATINAMIYKLYNLTDTEIEIVNQA